MTGWHWLAFFGTVLGAWALLYAMQVPGDLRTGAALYGHDFWSALCVVEPGLAGYPTVLAMWVAMSAAMMAPTFLPALATYEDLIATGAATRDGFLALLAGYLAVWLGFAALAAGAQVGLAGAGLLDPLGGSRSALLTALLLALAGAYQFTALKEACLSKCRQPLTFFMQHWAPGPARAAAMGLRLGVLCLGCCWALMALAFVGGTMNLAWMGLATLVMVLEKLPEIGRPVTRPLGLVLLAAAIATLVAGTG
ncbi:metal-binding protein [Maritimibacter sp. 55A14]|nr:metal-binding protein [Maritimibacter sp. 55A14]